MTQPYTLPDAYNLFNRGFDTKEISNMVRKTEAEVYNYLSQSRENRHFRNHVNASKREWYAKHKEELAALRRAAR